MLRPGAREAAGVELARAAVDAVVDVEHVVVRLGVEARPRERDGRDVGQLGADLGQLGAALGKLEADLGDIAVDLEVGARFRRGFRVEI